MQIKCGPIVHDNDLVATRFQEPPICLGAYISLAGKTKKQIDYIMINKKFRKGGVHCRTFRTADCGVD